MKKIILSLFVGFLCIISFCSATVYDVYTGHCNNNGNFCKSTTYLNLNGCNGNYYLVLLTTGDTNWELRLPTNGFMKSSTDSFFGQSFSCSNNKFSFIDRSTNGFDYVLKFVDYDEILNIGNSLGGGSCPECPTCPEVNTGEILSGYILESDINNLYCEEHGYCPIIDTGEELSGMSTLFINEIEHQSAPLINITIPEEYNRDSSVNTGEFKLVISGTNVDYEYIDNIIRTQNSKPSSEDLTNIVSGLIPLFIPGLCIILLLYFIYLFIKKIF